MNNEIKIGQVWQHFKGNHYKIIALGKHTETGEDLIGYEDMIDKKAWFRPAKMFFDTVEWNGQKTQRFTLLV